MPQWLCVINGQQSGPYTDDQVRAMVNDRRMNPNDLVWRDGMAQWAPAGSIPGLLGAVAGMYAQGPGAMDAYAPPMQSAGGFGVGSPLQSALPAPVVQHDNGPFQKIGGMFTVDRAQWVGTTVVSPQAFYLLKLARSQNTGYAVGGVVGMLVASAFSKSDDLRTCTVAELPPSVRVILDPKTKLAAKDAIVLPRGAVSRVGISSFLSQVTVSCGTEKFILSPGLFSGGKVKKFILDTGWLVGQDLVPTIMPMHGQGLGRRPGEGPKAKSAGVRVLQIVGAVVVIIIVIAIQAAANNK